jgi:hypothetical protein
LSAKVLTAAEVGAKAERTVQHALAKQGAVVTVPKLKGGQGFDAVGTFRSGTDISCINIVEVCPCVLKMVLKTFLDKCVCVFFFFFSDQGNFSSWCQGTFSFPDKTWSTTG